jgi:thermostable 8-oxoguanine DNA glycosylase
MSEVTKSERKFRDMIEQASDEKLREILDTSNYRYNKLRKARVIERIDGIIKKVPLTTMQIVSRMMRDPQILTGEQEDAIEMELLLREEQGLYQEDVELCEMDQLRLEALKKLNEQASKKI